MKNILTLHRFHEGTARERTVKITSSFMILAILSTIGTTLGLVGAYSQSGSWIPNASAQLPPMGNDIRNSVSILTPPTDVTLSTGRSRTFEPAAPHAQQTMTLTSWNRPRREYFGTMVRVTDACGIDLQNLAVSTTGSQSKGLGIVVQLLAPNTVAPRAANPSEASFWVESAPAPVLMLNLDTRIDGGSLYYVDGYTSGQMKVALTGISENNGITTATFQYCAPNGRVQTARVVGGTRTELVGTARTDAESNLFLDYTALTDTANSALVRVYRNVYEGTPNNTPDLVPLSIKQPSLLDAPLAIIVCNVGKRDADAAQLTYKLGSGIDQSLATPVLSAGRCAALHTTQNITDLSQTRSPDGGIDVVVTMDPGGTNNQGTLAEGFVGEKNNVLRTRITTQPDLILDRREAPRLSREVWYKACSGGFVGGIETVRVRFNIQEYEGSNRRRIEGPYYVYLNRSDHPAFFNGGCAWTHTNRRLREFFTPTSATSRVRLEATIDDNNQLREPNETNNTLRDSASIPVAQ